MKLMDRPGNRFVVYLRVSTNRQGASGLGLQAQRTAVENYVRSVGGVALAELVEIESGTKNSRPVLVQSISLCRKEKATLLIAKLDRLARNVAFISSLMEGGVEFVAADAPYANKLMLHILAAFAEHERELISQRTKSALAAARARGVQLGKNGHRLAAANRSEAINFAKTIEGAVRAAIDEGANTLASIAAVLNSRGFLTREGYAWSAGTTHRLIRRLQIHLK